MAKAKVKLGLKDESVVQNVAGGWKSAGVVRYRSDSQ